MAPTTLEPTGSLRAAGLVAFACAVGLFAAVPLAAFPLLMLGFAAVLALLLIPMAISATSTIVIDSDGIARRTALGSVRRIAWSDVREVTIDGRRTRECIVAGAGTKVSFMELRRGFCAAVVQVLRAARARDVPVKGGLRVSSRLEDWERELSTGARY